MIGTCLRRCRRGLSGRHLRKPRPPGGGPRGPGSRPSAGIRGRTFWRWLALSGVALVALFFLVALVFSWWARGPFAASAQHNALSAPTTLRVIQVPAPTTQPERTSARIQATSSAVRAAAALASALAGTAITSTQATRDIASVLENAGIPLARSAITTVAGAIWKKWGLKTNPPPLPPVVQPLSASTADTHVTVFIRGQGHPGHDLDDCRRSPLSAAQLRRVARSRREAAPYGARRLCCARMCPRPLARYSRENELRSGVMVKELVVKGYEGDALLEEVMRLTWLPTPDAQLLITSS
jgi:hypothetical protein